jgi:membrane dipeptidase
MRVRSDHVRFRLPTAAVLAVTLLACQAGGPAGEDEQPAAESAEDLQARAETLAHELLIVDTHVDVPYRLEEEWEDVSQRTEKGDFDYPRAVAGGLDAPFMSIYVPARYEDDGARDVADRLIDMVEKIADEHPDQFAIATSPAEVRAVVESGRIALPMGMENGSPIEGDLANVRHFYDRGIRYITLAHGESNHISDSSYDQERPWEGLSDFGREVVAEMNRLGIMVDVSHLSDDAFWDVIEVSEAPVIASHSSARRFTPGFERNMSDDMIRRLAENGGMILINFGSGFLLEEAQKQSVAMWTERTAFMEEHGYARDAPEVEEWMRKRREEDPTIYADVSDVADHIDHVVELVGVDHVGIGSDFDGVGDSLPTGLKDVSYYPNLIRVLLERGYSEEDVAKIAGENLMRVWTEVERVARAEQRSAA